MTQDMTHTTENWKLDVPRSHVLRMAGVGFRPSEEDITQDIDRLIKATIAGSIDQSNINLHYDELYGEMMHKVATILSKPDLHFENRGKFFGFLKVALNRHRSTLIQRYAFTAKRTGIKKGQEHTDDYNHECEEAQTKPSIIALDGLEQDRHEIASSESERESLDADEEMNAFIDTHLSPVEALVIRQELKPNDATYTYAYVENSSTSTKDGNFNFKFKVKDLHKAKGVGLELRVYKRILVGVRTKMEELFKERKEMKGQNENQQKRLAELALCEIFNMQVPAHVEPGIKRRAFTIAARDNFAKVDAEVAILMEKVGAHVPKKHGDTLSCFGVMWEANHRSCSMCALENSCKTNAANVSLDVKDFHLDKRLLGTKAAKTPMILPKIEPDNDAEMPQVSNLMVLTQSDRDEEIMDFMNETMTPVLHDGEIFYRLPDRATKRVFCVGQPERLMCLRFCNPSDSIKTELVSIGKGPMWTIPDDMSLEDVMSLMNEHIANQLK